MKLSNFSKITQLVSSSAQRRQEESTMGVSPAMLRLGAREDLDPELSLNSALNWRMMTKGACMIGR